MRPAAGFKSNKAWRQVGKESQHIFSFQLSVEYILAVFIHAMNLKIFFCNIKSDPAYFTHDPPPVWLKCIAMSTFWHFDAAESMTRWGGRVYPITP